jgi:hypothetical protein
MNDANFRAFKNGGRHSYHGGAFDYFPARGFWHITLAPPPARRSA